MYVLKEHLEAARIDGDTCSTGDAGGLTFPLGCINFSASMTAKCCRFNSSPAGSEGESRRHQTAYSYG